MEVELDELCLLSPIRGEPSSHLLLVRDIKTCSVDVILRSSGPITASGLLLGSLRPHEPGGQPVGNDSIPPLYFIDPPTAAEISTGMQLQAAQLHLPEVLNLPDANIMLKADVHVTEGRALTIRGMGGTIAVGNFQFVVEANGKLELDNVTVSGAVDKPAIENSGFTALHRTILTKNHLAVYVMPSGDLNVTSSKFVNNGGGTESDRAIECTKGRIVLKDTVLSSNRARSGCALRVIEGCNVFFLGRSTISNNYAHSGGGALEVFCGVRACGVRACIRAYGHSRVSLYAGSPCVCVLAGRQAFKGLCVHVYAACAHACVRLLCDVCQP